MRSRTHERARAFYYLFHCCFEIPRSRSRFKPSTIASIRREEWACNWKEKEEQGGKKGEGENFFSETKINKERFIRNFKVARKGDRKKEREREGKTAVRRLVTRLAKVVSRTREKAVNDSTEGYLALCAARLDQQEAAQRGDVSRDFLLLSTDKTNRALCNTRNPVFARGLIIRRRGLPRENGSIRIAVRENRRRKLRREK